MGCTTITITNMVTLIVTVGGTGKGSISINDQSTSTSKTFTFNVGDNVTVSATPDAGSSFVKFTQTNPPGETTQNPFTAPIQRSGTITAIFNLSQTAGFTIKADKTWGLSAYNAVISISNPNDLNGTVRLAAVDQLGVTHCINGADNIKLDANGQATFNLQITQDTELFALGGIGCTCLLVSLCSESNHLKFTVGVDLTTVALAGLAIGVAYLAIIATKSKGRQAPYISLLR